MAVQVRLVLLTSLPLTASVSSVKVTVRLVSQAELNSGVPKTGAAGHWIARGHEHRLVYEPLHAYMETGLICGVRQRAERAISRRTAGPS